MADPLLSHTSPQMSGYIASPTPLPPHCSVSKPACHCQQATRGPSRQGHQAHQRLPGDHEVTRRLAVPGRPGPVVGLNGGELCPEEKDWWRSRSSALIRAYGLSSYPGACWPPLNGTPRKSSLCHCVQSSKAVTFPSFWQSLAAQHALRRQNEQRTAGQFRADCCPAGDPLYVLPASLISTHKHTEDTWLCVTPLPFLCCLCVPWLASWFGVSKQNK